MNKHPILLYFGDGKGRAELVRLIFIYGGVPFEDRRISFQEYVQMRDNGELPFGQLPILEVSGTLISQSCAIARYAAKEAECFSPLTGMRVSGKSFSVMLLSFTSMVSVPLRGFS